jgi:hypothetical protein
VHLGRRRQHAVEVEEDGVEVVGVHGENTNGASPQPVEPCRGAGWVWGSGRLGSPVAGVPATGI